jgi:dienelactone hydrolase
MSSIRRLLPWLCLLWLLPVLAAKGPALRTQTRPLWTSSPVKDHLREWLLCGPFAFPAPLPQERTPAAVALAKDYLTRYGGEAAVRPLVDPPAARKSLSPSPWTRYQSTPPFIDLHKAFAGRPGSDVVGYAYTTLQRKTAGPVVLVVGSDDAVKLWVNGQVCGELPPVPPMAYAEGRYLVDLPAGESALLVKIAQCRVSWGFSVRVLEPGAALQHELTSARLYPCWAPDLMHGDTLAIRTDRSTYSALPQRATVRVEVLGAGARTLATARVLRGDPVRFATTGWPGGPYTVRFTVEHSAPLVTATLNGYQGDPLPAIARLLWTAPAADDPAPAAAVHRLLADVVGTRLYDRLGLLHPEALPESYQSLLEYDDLQTRGVMALPPAGTGGLLRMPYRDPIDDSPQFCRVYLPPGYEPAKRYPLILVLHGRAATDVSYARSGGVEARYDGLAERYNVIVAHPFARGNSWYRGIGEVDVLRCLELIHRRLPIDENRVYLLGYSMGGAGVWYFGSRHPEPFAAMAAFYGGYDYRFQFDDATLARMSPRERFRRERFSHLSQAEGLSATPLFVSHGDADSIVDVDYSRYAVRMLQTWGFDIRYREHPGGAHGGLSGHDEVLNWLLAHRREAPPRQVRLRAADLRTAAAHWVRVTQRADPYAFIHADAEIIGANTIRLVTTNVLEVVLTPPATRIDPRRPVQLIVNGILLPPQALTEGQVMIRLFDYQRVSNHKTPDLAGPADALCTTPFALVIGTEAADPQMRAALAEVAGRIEKRWVARYAWKPRIVHDVDLSEALKQTHSLVLLGGPQENAVAREWADTLGVQLAADAVTIDGQRMKSSHAAVQLTRPHPLAADCYVVMLAATSLSGVSLIDALLTDVDWCVLTREKRALRYRAGYCDYTWRLDPTMSEAGELIWPLPPSGLWGNREKPIP